MPRYSANIHKDLVSFHLKMAVIEMGIGLVVPAYTVWVDTGQATIYTCFLFGFVFFAGSIHSLGYALFHALSARLAPKENDPL